MRRAALAYSGPGICQPRAAGRALSEWNQGPAGDGVRDELGM